MGRETRGGIYKITNTVNGKVYVGSATRFTGRWSKHRTDLNKNCHDNQKLQRAWNKYGEAAFVFSVLEYVENKCDLIQREQFWIDALEAAETGYNICTVAYSCLGVKRSENTKKKMSEIAKARGILPETRLKAIQYHTGRKRSPEVAARQSTAQKGRKDSDETRAKKFLIAKNRSPEMRARIAAPLKGRIFTPEHRAKLAESKKSVSPETRQKMAAAKLGKKQSPEMIAKRSAGMRGRKMSPESIAKTVATKARMRAERIAAETTMIQPTLDL